MPKQVSKRELKQIGLSPSNPSECGITRRKSGKGFSFIDPQGQTIRDPELIARLNSLAIPPAWTDVWICPDENGYLQATGYDAKGRKQFIYHPKWREHADEVKFSSLNALKKALPKIRAAVDRHLRQKGLTKERVLAAIVHLIDQTWMRVGNERYVEENGSYGITTLRNRHVEVGTSKVAFKFKGKSGKSHWIRVENRRIAGLLARCRQLPGSRLFQYLDADGKPTPIRSRDVNDYLRQVSQANITAKDFRTWHATHLAEKLVKTQRPRSKRELNRIVSLVAERLGNTPTVCRKSYIAPVVLENIPPPQDSDAA
jgi:DNA topoisomerase-1